MKFEFSDEEREALTELLWCIQHDMPTRMTLEKILPNIMKHAGDGHYGSIHRNLENWKRRLGESVQWPVSFEDACDVVSNLHAQLDSAHDEITKLEGLLYSSRSKV